MEANNIPGNYISKIKACLRASIGLEPIITNLEVANNIARNIVFNIKKSRKE
jgi:hypothetical protein